MIKGISFTEITQAMNGAIDQVGRSTFGWVASATVVIATAARSVLEQAFAQTTPVYRPGREFSCYLFLTCREEPVLIGEEPSLAALAAETLRSCVAAPACALLAVAVCSRAVRILRKRDETNDQVPEIKKPEVKRSEPKVTWRKPLLSL